MRFHDPQKENLLINKPLIPVQIAITAFAELFFSPFYEAA
jgi:hypothetical protein